MARRKASGPKKPGVKVPWFEVFSLLISLIVPILGELKKSADPESDGGIKITNEEAKKIAKIASDKIYKAISDRWLNSQKPPADPE